VVDINPQRSHPTYLSDILSLPSGGRLLLVPTEYKDFYKSFYVLLNYGSFLQWRRWLSDENWLTEIYFCSVFGSFTTSSFTRTESTQQRSVHLIRLGAALNHRLTGGRPKLILSKEKAANQKVR